MFSCLRFLERLGFVAEVRRQQGVFILEAVQHLQNRRAVVVKTVVAPPLQIPDLHRDLRQLEGVRIDFNGLQLRNGHLGRELKAKLRRKRDDFLFESQEQLQRDVKKVAAAAGGVEHRHRAKLFLELGQPFALRGVAFAFDAGGGKLALDLRPLLPEGLHQDGFHQCFDVGFAGVMRAQLVPVAFVQSALKQRAHDARLNKLPVRLRRLAQNPKLLLVQFKNARIVKQMPVEMTNLVRAKIAAFGHDAKEVFQGPGKVRRIINGGFEDVGKKVRREKPRVLGKHAKNNPIEKPGDAQVFPLRVIHFGAAPGVRQFHAFPFLERMGHFADFFRQRFRHGGGRLLRLEVFGIGEKGAKRAEIFRAVNLVVGEFVNLRHRAVEIGLDDVAFKIAHHEQRRIEQ